MVESGLIAFARYAAAVRSAEDVTARNADILSFVREDDHYPFPALAEANH